MAWRKTSLVWAAAGFWASLDAFSIGGKWHNAGSVADEPGDRELGCFSSLGFSYSDRWVGRWNNYISELWPPCPALSYASTKKRLIQRSVINLWFYNPKGLNMLKCFVSKALGHKLWSPVLSLSIIIFPRRLRSIVVKCPTASIFEKVVEAIISQDKQKVPHQFLVVMSLWAS